MSANCDVMNRQSPPMPSSSASTTASKNGRVQTRRKRRDTCAKSPARIAAPERAIVCRSTAHSGQSMNATVHAGASGRRRCSADCAASAMTSRAASVATRSTSGSSPNSGAAVRFSTTAAPTRASARSTANGFTPSKMPSRHRTSRSSAPSFAKTSGVVINTWKPKEPPEKNAGAAATRDTIVPKYGSAVIVGIVRIVLYHIHANLCDPTTKKRASAIAREEVEERSARNVKVHRLKE
jgi:hypothetical protein